MLVDQSIITNKYDNGYPGSYILDANNDWTDVTQRPGVDAHVYTGLFYDYLWAYYAYNGYDDIGSGLFTIVESPLMQDQAIFDDVNNRVIYFTATVNHRSWAGCIESIAHEWSHGITITNANMPYMKESGALEESFGNMMGATTRWHYSGRPLPPYDWTLYSNTNQSGLPIYRMDYPHGGTGHPLEFQSRDKRPDFYNDPVDWYPINNCTPSINNDMCGVHTNSGVPDKMFSLLAEGGTSSHNGVVVSGIGIESAMKVMFGANKDYWNDTTTTFMRARWGVIESGRINFQNRFYAIEAANAWNAVGVCDSCAYVPGDANNNGYATGMDITYMNNVLKGLAPPLNTCTLNYGYNPGSWTNFYAAADFNGDCQFNGMDISYAVAYFKGQQPAILWCPHFTPGSP